MPTKPMRPCKKCGNLVRETYCEKCKPQYKRPGPTSWQKGYDSRWRKARLVFLAQHPWCAECLRQERYTPAIVVDHIIPHKGDKTLFWDEKNWQSLCEHCHNVKSAGEQ